jgi:hypothetical protein
MGFRRSKDAAHESLRWREFLHDQEDVLAAAGLPGALSDHERFLYFIEHGYVPMPGGHADGTMFSVDELDTSQRRALGRLLSVYVADFYAPGEDPETALYGLGGELAQLVRDARATDIANPSC